MTTTKQILQMLGPTYGGPSISKDGEYFVFYEWSDAPVGIYELARGKNLTDLVNDYWDKKRKK